MPSADHARLLAMLRARPLPKNPPLAERRVALEKLAKLFPLARDVSVERACVGGRACEWIATPDSEPGRVVLYLHGGAYLAGSCTTHRELASRLARAARARVALLEYRLAPEWPFPTAVGDALAACRALRPHALAGDSAGGGLALATLVALRDAGDPLPACAALLSPWADLACTGASLTQFRGRDPLLDAELLGACAASYLQGADPRDPRASPLYADLRGLPPLLVQVGSEELLHDDSARLVTRARAAGVAARLEVWERMPHVWHLFASMLVEGREAIARMGEFVCERSPLS